MTGPDRVIPAPGRDSSAPEETAARLMRTVDTAFLTAAGWNAERLELYPPPDHPLLARGLCQITNCDSMTATRGLCFSCNARSRKRGDITYEEFLKIPRDGRRKGLPILCTVPNCPRLRCRIKTGLCPAHDNAYLKQQRDGPMSVDEFIAQPKVRPLPDWGACDVESCSRPRDSRHQFCKPHRDRWFKHLQEHPDGDMTQWARTAWPIAYGHMVGMHGLPQLVIAELLTGIQYRCRDGAITEPPIVRGIVHAVRAHRAASVFDLPDTLPRTHRQYLSTIRTAVRLALSSPEDERRKDTCNLLVFGHRGVWRFGTIRQPWLRETAKRWCADDLPRRRGRAVHGVMQVRLKSIDWLSESLRIQRDDHGEDLSRLGRHDIENYLSRLAFLSDIGQISARQRVQFCRFTRRVLNDVRALGLTQPGEPASGLPDTFVLRRTDIPHEAKIEGPGRSVPQPVMQQLYNALHHLEAATSTHTRTAVELLMDTGRRPDEVITIEFDCLDVADDGKYVMIYTDYKEHRERRRLPITDTTATVIRDQQKRVRDLFPQTPAADLKLFPAKQRNRDGRRSLTESSITSPHRDWINTLPPLLRADGSELDKASIVLYSYRHSYAQRHADAGTDPDVLRELMGHTDLNSTQAYYRVTEKRVRSAIDKLVTLQFDRHGNRVWPQAKALLDHEHARMRVGTVSVPFGTCSEPSNVKANGHACPFRFRCLGCGHFRTDPSYLPELREYLHTLLRDRERVRAAIELDSWAAAEAMPSDEEIDRLRALIRRTEQAVGDLDDADRAALDDATCALRKVRRVVHLGLPSTAPPHTDPRLERDG